MEIKVIHPTWDDLMSAKRIGRVHVGTDAAAPCPLTPADVQHAATEGRNTERDRMLARLMSMEPSREPYSKPQSEWGRREARRLWERMRDAIVDGKEAHKDRDVLEGDAR